MLCNKYPEKTSSRSVKILRSRVNRKVKFISFAHSSVFRKRKSFVGLFLSLLSTMAINLYPQQCYFSDSSAGHVLVFAQALWLSTREF